MKNESQLFINFWLNNRNVLDKKNYKKQRVKQQDLLIGFKKIGIKENSNFS